MNYDKAKWAYRGMQSWTKEQWEKSHKLPKPPMRMLRYQATKLKELGLFDPRLTFTQAREMIEQAEKTKEIARKLSQYRKENT